MKRVSTRPRADQFIQTRPETHENFPLTQRGIGNSVCVVSEFVSLIPVCISPHGRVLVCA